MNENDNGNIVNPENNVSNEPAMQVANQEGVMPNPVVESGNNTLPNEEKKKSKLPIILVIVVLLLAVGGFFAYKMFFTNPVEEAITSMFKEVKSNNLLGKSIKETANISFDTSNKELAFIKNYSIDTEVSYDKNMNMLSKLVLNEKGSALLDLVLKLDKNNLYFKLPKVTNKTYSAKVENANIQIKEEDVLFLTNKLEEGIKKAFKEEKLNKKNIDVGVGGKTISVSYNYYTIDKTNVERITNKLLSVFEEEESLKRLSNITKQEVSDIKEDINDIKEETKDAEGDEKIDIGVYTKGLFNTVVGFEYSMDDKTRLYYVLDGENGSGKLTDEESKSLIELTQTGNKIDVTISMENKKVASMNITKVNDNEANMEIIIPEYLTIRLKTKLAEISSLEAFDTTGAKDVNNLTEAEAQELLTNLSKVLEKSELKGLLQSFVNGSNTESGM